MVGSRRSYGGPRRDRSAVGWAGTRLLSRGGTVAKRARPLSRSTPCTGSERSPSLAKPPGPLLELPAEALREELEPRLLLEREPSRQSLPELLDRALARLLIAPQGLEPAPELALGALLRIELAPQLGHEPQPLPPELGLPAAEVGELPIEDPGLLLVELEKLRHPSAAELLEALAQLGIQRTLAVPGVLLELARHSGRRPILGNS